MSLGGNNYVTAGNFLWRISTIQSRLGVRLSNVFHPFDNFAVRCNNIIGYPACIRQFLPYRYPGRYRQQKKVEHPRNKSRMLHLFLIFQQLPAQGYSKTSWLLAWIVPRIVRDIGPTSNNCNGNATIIFHGFLVFSSRDFSRGRRKRLA